MLITYKQDEWDEFLYSLDPCDGLINLNRINTYWKKPPPICPLFGLNSLTLILGPRCRTFADAYERLTKANIFQNLITALIQLISQQKLLTMTLHRDVL